MKNLKVPSLVTIAILTVITVVFWIFFSVYRVFTTQPSPTVPGSILEPLSPNLDTGIINSIQQRVFFSGTDGSTLLIPSVPQEEQEEIPEEGIVAVPEETPTPEATESSELILE